MPDPNPIRAGADRNLLFGILALQMDFITRDALIAAMNAWIIDKAKPLGQILQEQDRLSSDRLLLLDALVNEHVKAHGGNVEQSLASSSLAWIRRAMVDVDDPDVQASLAKVSKAREEDDPLATSGPSVGESTSTGLRFRILRPHAEGGLGRVFVARDEELSREVALKEIKDSHADEPQSRARFLLEAEITGGLEHPGIVPVYGLGTYADGRPFYAMRFIRGHSLKDAIERFHKSEVPGRDAGERTLELRKLLGRFIDVCEAIAYAHSRGVLHRDLKPGNVMLGKYGETLVVDWGLAKAATRERSEVTKLVDAEPTLRPASGTGVAETQAGVALGTPAFMSPEQAAGRLDEIGTTSDVYSLGATLYCLLTGMTPINASDIGELLQKVQAGEITPPRAVNKNVPAALEAVCLKAMALKPADRYGSTLELAAEVEHWLADEPVTAYPEKWTNRIARWSRRHKAIVTVVAAAAVVLLCTLTLSNILIRKAKGEADENFRLAYDAVDRYFVQVSENRLLNEPGMQPLRQELLESARSFYQQFIEKRSHEPSLQADLATAYFRLAAITAFTKATHQAIDLYRRAGALFEALNRAYPDEERFQVGVAECLDSLGRAYADMNEFEAAEKSHYASLSVRQTMAQRHDAEHSARRDLAHSYHNLGWLYQRAGRADEAEAAYQQSLSIFRWFADRFPDRTAVQRDLSATLNNLGVMSVDIARFERAIEFHREALPIRAELVVRNPRVLEYRSLLAATHINLGLAQCFAGLISEANESYRFAIALSEELVAGNPEVVPYQMALGAALSGAGEALRREHRHEEALERLGRAICTLEEARTRDPDHVDVKLQLRNAFYNRALTLIALGRDADAIPDWDRSISISEGPQTSKTRLQRAQSLGRIGDSAAALDELESLVKDSEDSYQAACVYSLAAKAVTDDGKLAATERAQRAERYAARSIRLLRSAHEGGFFSDPNLREQVRKDSDLDPLRAREDFKQLLAELESKNPQPSSKPDSNPTESSAAAERMERLRLAVWMVAGWPMVR